MTKKDYELIAQCISKAKTPPINPSQFEGVRHVELNISLALKRDNERFNTQKFLNACEYKPN